MAQNKRCKFHVFCCPIKASLLFNLCVWILFQNVRTQRCGTKKRKKEKLGTLLSVNEVYVCIPLSCLLALCCRVEWFGVPFCWVVWRVVILPKNFDIFHLTEAVCSSFFTSRIKETKENITPETTEEPRSKVRVTSLV